MINFNMTPTRNQGRQRVHGSPSKVQGCMGLKGSVARFSIRELGAFFFWGGAGGV